MVNDMKRILALILALLMLFTLAACGGSANDSDEPADAAEQQTEASDEAEESTDDTKIAEEGETGGDLYRVTAVDPYPEDYNATADRAKEEQDNDVHPEIVVDITEEQMAQYDTVFFGFPVWGYDLPMSMWTFLESYDFSGKTIIPFFSHEGSSNGANALPTIESLAKGATVRSDDALSVRGGNVDGAESEVREWVQGLDY